MNITHKCEFCTLAEVETIEHVMCHCPSYSFERKALMLNLQMGLTATPQGQLIFNTISQMDIPSITYTLLGEHDRSWPIEASVLIHRCSRQFQLQCWEKRAKMLGLIPMISKDGCLSVQEISAVNQRNSATPILVTPGSQSLNSLMPNTIQNTMHNNMRSSPVPPIQPIAVNNELVTFMMSKQYN